MSKGLKYTLQSFLILDIIGVLLAFLFSSTLLIDDFEHLRMSYLVSQDYVPYLDFFEHHHPLLWYVFAPFMKILPHNIIIALYLARGSALIARILMFYFIYLILKRFFGDGRLMFYFLLAAFSFYPIWYGFSYFKPDAFEQLFFFMGLYFFFAYIHDSERLMLVISGLCFTISFLFLQTVVFSFLPLFIMFMHMAKRNSKVITDFLISAVLPFLLLSGIAFYMYKNGLIGRYYELNWVLNSHIFNLSDDVTDCSSFMPYFLIQLCIGMACLVRNIRKDNNPYIKTIGLLYVFSIIEHTFFVAIGAHYLILTLIYCSILIAPVLKEILAGEKNKVAVYVVAYFLFYLLFNFTNLYFWNNRDLFNLQKIVSDAEVDNTVNMDNTYKFVWNKHISYYEMCNTLHKVDDYLFHTMPEYDVNKQIALYKPKYLEYNTKLAQKHHKYKIKNQRFEVSPDTLLNYQQIYPHLWQRKDTLSQ